MASPGKPSPAFQLRTVSVAMAAVLACACTSGGSARGPQTATTRAAGPTPSASTHISGLSPSQSGQSASVPAPTTRRSATTVPSEPPEPVVFSSERAMRTVRHLAVEIGPRHATSSAYVEAASWVTQRLRSLGYDVEHQRFDVPGGNSWGVDVSAGRSQNVVAATSDFSPHEPYLLVGAHLDTVPVAPGAEDNASGVSVVLELARSAASGDRPTRLPVVFVLFGAEEPRGPGDDDHHYGSSAYVAQMSPAERQHLVAMVSLDRVGVGTVVPVCTGGLSPVAVQRQLLRAAEAEYVATSRCNDNRSSDHWSFEKSGFTVARLGSTPYAGYHDETDVPSVVNVAQLRRVGTLMQAWLTG